MTPTKAQLEQASIEGLTQAEAAQRFGCGSTTIQRCQKRYGVYWKPRPCPHRPLPEIKGERITLAEASRRYGIPLSTIWKRYRVGDRGDRLIRTVYPRAVPAPTDAYEVGLSVVEWQGVIEVAQALSPRSAARRFDIPVGAVNAAVRGEWERLA